MVDVLLGWRLVLAGKVVCSVLAKPDSEFANLLSKAGDRLLIHSGLGNELRERRCKLLEGT